MLVAMSSASTEMLGRRKEQDALAVVHSWMKLSEKPMQYAIALPAQQSIVKMIRQSKVFALAVLPESYKRRLEQMKHTDGLLVDLFAELGLKKVQCEKIDCVRIAEAQQHMECELIAELPLDRIILFIGKVIRTEPPLSP